MYFKRIVSNRNVAAGRHSLEKAYIRVVVIITESIGDNHIIRVRLSIVTKLKISQKKIRNRIL